MNIKIEYDEFDRWNEDIQIFNKIDPNLIYNNIEGKYTISMETDIPETVSRLVTDLNKIDFSKIEINDPVFYNLAKKLLEFENKRIEVELQDE